MNIYQNKFFKMKKIVLMAFVVLLQIACQEKSEKESNLLNGKKVNVEVDENLTSTLEAQEELKSQIIALSRKKDSLLNVLKSTNESMSRINEGKIDKGIEGVNMKLNELKGQKENFQEQTALQKKEMELAAKKVELLTQEKIDIRLSGQDVERGTFSHRHSVLHGTESLERFIPLNNLDEVQGRYMVYNSLLSEFAVLGFEFGYSSMYPDALVIWEAQFGDFGNGAQIIIDQYLSSSEAKWGQTSSVVMLLPHGFEGQGPEHSSARLERFLQLCAEDNLQVVNCTTPSQYFHLLRRQAKQNKRKPLIVMSPKSLLRHPMAVSKSDELANGSFQLVIPDANVGPDKAKRIVLCSGKVYYDLLKFQQENDIKDVAIARLEQFYPFPDHDIKELFASHSNVSDIVWCQEEPRNMGGWNFVWSRLMSETQEAQSIRYIGRVAAAAPATGSAKLHAAEQERLVERAMTIS